jgi:hypothetical protein
MKQLQLRDFIRKQNTIKKEPHLIEKFKIICLANICAKYNKR